MTVYKVDNIYYNEESIQQYINEHLSFSDFIKASIDDESGTVRGVLNNLFSTWNSENQNEVVNYLNTLNVIYVSYLNNQIGKLPRFTVVEGGAEKQPEVGSVTPPNEMTQPIEAVPEVNTDE